MVPRPQAPVPPSQRVWSCVRSLGVWEVVSLALQGLPIEVYGEKVQMVEVLWELSAWEPSLSSRSLRFWQSEITRFKVASL